MIIDHIKNAAQYAGLGKRIQAGLEWLAATDFSVMAPGRYELDGNNLYALVQTYDTRDPALGKWEAHRRYIDIQYVVSGREKMGYAEISTLVGSGYDAEKDFQLLVGEGDFLTCGPGTFILFAPQDAHMPCLAADKPQTVTKVVVKVLAE
jgi:YhcH/YjgK/YiaL family protein